MGLSLPARVLFRIRLALKAGRQTITFRFCVGSNFSFLFRLLFALLCVNLLACSFNRLHMLKSTTFPSPQQIKKSNLEQLPLVHRFTLRAGDKPVEDLLADFFHRRRFSVRKFHEGATTWLYVSRGSAGPWFSFGLHISLVVLVAGFAWGERPGWKPRYSFPWASRQK